MNSKIIIIIAAIAILIGMNSFFIVDQTSQAIVLEFGKPVSYKKDNKEMNFINTPGLKFKIPFIQKVVYFDKRIMNFDVNDKTIYDNENKAIVVNAFTKYIIDNPLHFYEKVTNIRGINRKLDTVVEASLKDAIGSVTIKSLLTEDRTLTMQNVKRLVSNKAKDFGIKILDVRIVRADLPKENELAIFKRMYTDRNKEAREYRAEGKEEAKTIRSKALKEATIIKAEAEKNSQIIRGKGDAEATKIVNSAYSKDPNFFEFYNTMKAYRQSIKKEDTTMVLSPDTEFMKFFKEFDVN